MNAPGTPHDLSDAKRPTAHRVASWTVAVALPAATLYVLFFVTGTRRISEFFAGADLRALALAAALYAALSVSKAARWRLLVGSGLRARDYYSASSIHNLFALLVPLGFGEFTFVYIFASRHSLPAGKGLVALAAGRIYDTAVMLALSGGVVAAFYGMWPLTIVAAAAIVATGVLTGPLSRTSARAAGRLSERAGRSKIGFVNVAAGPLGHAREALARGFPAWPVLGLTVLTLGLIACFLGTVAGAFMPEVPTAALMTAAFVVPLGAMIPLKGFADFGKFEVVWLWALSVVAGLRYEEGFTAGFGVHVVALAFAGASAGVGWAVGRTGVPKRFDTPRHPDTIQPD